MFALGLLALAGCATAENVYEESEVEMFESRTLDDLQFLEGRWVGTGPDGKPFYEVYRRVDSDTLVSERYQNQSFDKIVDGSTIKLEKGEITSQWGEFIWRADEVRPGFASFIPVNAPSAFTWRKIDQNTVQVTQRWTDENGVEQRYDLELKRTN